MSQPHPSKAAADAAAAETLQAARARVAELEEKLAAAESQLNARDVTEKEKETYEIIIAAMAIQAYRHIPGKKNGTVSSVLKAAGDLGMPSRDADTIRERIKLAILRTVKRDQRLFKRFLTLKDVKPSDED